MKHRIICMVGILLAVCSCFGQQTFIVPLNFEKIPQPIFSDSVFSKLNNSKVEIKVGLVDGKLIAQKIDFSKVEDCDDCYCKLKIKDGMLKGQNYGEWGGELYYEPDNVNELNVRIKKGNIRYIFEKGDSLYFLEGLAHWMMVEGALFRLYRKGNTFNYQKIFDFDDAPAAFFVLNSKLLIAGSGSFFLLDGLRKEVVFEKLFWHGLYPNSVVALDEQNVFVGMRSGFAHLDLTLKKLDFYKYIGL